MAYIACYSTSLVSSPSCRTNGSVSDWKQYPTQTNTSSHDPSFQLHPAMDIMKTVVFNIKTVNEDMQDVWPALSGSGQSIFLVGAGISTSAGLEVCAYHFAPSTSSQSPLQDYETINSGGSSIPKDIFEATTFQNKRNEWDAWMAELTRRVQGLEPTSTHMLLGQLAERGHLRRCFTQNVDGLERKVPGLNCGDKFWPSEGSETPGRIDESVHCIFLHGCLQLQICTGCRAIALVDKDSIDRLGRSDHSHTHQHQGSSESARTLVTNADKTRSVSRTQSRKGVLLDPLHHPSGGVGCGRHTRYRECDHYRHKRAFSFGCHGNFPLATK